jgi:hypothetical protein
MLNVLSDIAQQGETILAVWVWGPSTLGNLLSNVLGSVGPPGDPATATSMVESAIQNATGIDGAEAATAYTGPSALYIGMTLTVNSDGDGVPFNNLLSSIANLGGFFTNGEGPILAFVDYGDPGESSGPLAQSAAAHDDSGQLHGGLVPLSSINGIQDAIDALGPETPYFQGVWGVSQGAAVGGAGVPVATGGATGGFSATLTQQSTTNANVATAAATAQTAAQGVKNAATGASIGIVGVLIALIIASALFGKGVKA